MGERMLFFIDRWNNFYNEKLDGNKKIRLLLFAFCFVVIAVTMFRLNRLTLWVVDDLLKEQAARNIHNFNQLFALAHNFYLGWGGRVWGEIYAQLFLMIPKPAFNYINTFGYMLLLLLIQWNILGKWKLYPGLLIFIHFSLLLCLPAFGQDVLWISGAANYMWASLFPLLFLGLWRSYQANPSPKFNHPLSQLIILLLGVFAGWANENVSVALLMIALGYMYIYRKDLSTIPRFAYAGTLGLFIGSLALWLAPGNFVRFAAEKHSKSIFHMVHMLYGNMKALVDPSATLFLVIAFVLLLLGVKNIKKAVAVNFFVGAIASSLAFSVVGQIYNRVFFGLTVLLIIAVGILYVQCANSLKARKLQCVVAIFLLLGSLGFYQQARAGIKEYADRWHENVQIIQQEKDHGNMDVFINPVPPKNKFCATYGLDDIKPQDENKHWLNTGVAKFYGIHTIQTVKVTPEK